MMVAAMVAALAGAGRQGLQAQGVTTGGIAGQVTDQASGTPLEGVQVQVVNTETGLTRNALTGQNGRYTVLGLETGRRYSVSARRIGFGAQSREDVRVALSQTTPINFVLATQAAVLSAVQVTGTQIEGLITPTRTGVSTTVSDTALRRLPTLDRNFTDFVRLTPQVGNTQGVGATGGGVSNRFNSVQIDGASEIDLFGLGGTGQPGSNAQAKNIPLEAVKEYQVLLSPFDVRQGNFTGLLVNAVTQSGTNEFHGTAFAQTRNETLTRDQPYINEYQQTQYGFSLGGPIVKNRAFFFVSPEIQTQSTPVVGPARGVGNFYVDDPTLGRFESILGSQYGIPAGSAGPADNENPLTNIFGRLDFNLPAGNRLVLRHNYGKARLDNLSRDISGSSPVFRYSSNLYQNNSEKNSTVAQLFTNFANGANNELIIGYSSVRDERIVPVRAPQITVAVPNATGTGSVRLRAGTENSSQGNSLDQDIFEITDNFTMPIGSHRLTVGTKNEFYKIRNEFQQNSFGNWSFSSLDNFEAGVADTLLLGVPVGGDGQVRFKARTLGGYLQDFWQVTPNFNVTAGLRMDIPQISDKPPANEIVIDTATGRSVNTRDIPSGNVQWSPRIGFNWDITGDQRNQLRGGWGVFVGRPAFVWISNAFQNSGMSGVASLTCTGANVPAFDATPGALETCADGVAPSVGGAINTLDEDFRFPQSAKYSLGFDRDIGHGFVATIEGLYTDGMYAPFYRNLTLAGVQGTDRFGRAIYGTLSRSTSGSFSTRTVRTAGRDVIDATNQGDDHSYSITTGLQRRYTGRSEFSAFYTYGRAFDVASYSSSVALSNFRLGRSVAGSITDTDASTSRFEQRHRLVLSGTYTLPTKTDLSFIYTGQSGSPYDYTYGFDLNGDGISGNDLLYVPKSAYDPNEVRFTGNPEQVVEQQAALERYIESEPCLREQRGQIMGRNSCRAPWTNLVNVSLRQSLPTIRGQNLSLQLDAFNFLNLLNNDWGRQPNVGGIGGGTGVSLFNVTGFTTAADSSLLPLTGENSAQPIVRFNTSTNRFNVDRLESNYQLQASIRYAF